MNNINQESLSQKKEHVFMFLLYLSLIIGFIFDENSTGGAYLDYINQKQVSKNFADNFLSSLLNYDEFTTRHSPILIIALSFFEKIKLSDSFIRLIYLHLNLILPMVFYHILKIKYNNIDKKYLILLTGLIFLSPIYRSLSIWPDSRLLGLTIFCFSILYFIKFQKEKKFSHVFLNVIFCALSSYVSPNFSVFAIFYFYEFFKNYGFKNKKLFLIIILNAVLAMPAFYYIFILDVNFLLKTATPGLQSNNPLFTNIFNQLIIIPTIFLFYITPFLITKIFDVEYKIKTINIFISSILIIISLIFFNYKAEFTGGGFYFQLSNYLFNNNILFFFIAFFSIYLLINISNLNFIIIIALILSNPQVTIYHKYYDPFLIILFFSLFNFKIHAQNFKKIINVAIIYLYFICFLFLNLYKYLWKI